MSTHARPIAGVFLSLPWTFRLLNLLIFLNFIKIMLPVDYGYLHNSIGLFIVNWASISVFRAGFGRFRPVSLGFVKKTHPLLGDLAYCRSIYYGLNYIRHRPM